MPLQSTASRIIHQADEDANNSSRNQSISESIPESSQGRPLPYAMTLQSTSSEEIQPADEDNNSSINQSISENDSVRDFQSSSPSRLGTNPKYYRH